MTSLTSKTSPTTAKRRCAGLSLPEVLISLAISSALLTAIGSAFVASSDIIQHNDQINRATQGARVAVNRMTAELRTAQSAVIDSKTVELVTAKGERREYVYDSDRKELSVTLPDVIDTPTYVIARSISNVDFATDTVTTTIRMTATVGKNSVTLSASATPRRNVEFK